MSSLTRTGSHFRINSSQNRSEQSRFSSPHRERCSVSGSGLYLIVSSHGRLSAARSFVDAGLDFIYGRWFYEVFLSPCRHTTTESRLSQSSIRLHTEFDTDTLALTSWEEFCSEEMIVKWFGHLAAPPSLVQKDSSLWIPHRITNLLPDSLINGWHVPPAVYSQLVSPFTVLLCYRRSVLYRIIIIITVAIIIKIWGDHHHMQFLISRTPHPTSLDTVWCHLPTLAGYSCCSYGQLDSRSSSSARDNYLAKKHHYRWACVGRSPLRFICCWWA